MMMLLLMKKRFTTRCTQHFRQMNQPQAALEAAFFYQFAYLDKI